MGTGRKFESSFRFPGDWAHVHSVEGPMPKVIFPYPDINIDYNNVNELDNKIKMYVALNTIIKVEESIKDLTVISFDHIDMQLIAEVLKFMNIPVVIYAPTLFPDKKTPKALAHLIKSSILITDYVGARGMEFKDLIVSCDPEETHIH